MTHPKGFDVLKIYLDNLLCETMALSKGLTKNQIQNLVYAWAKEYGVPMCGVTYNIIRTD